MPVSCSLVFSDDRDGSTRASGETRGVEHDGGCLDRLGGVVP
jgi:hypothetical protein